jgi:2-hydroxy-3-oxopropionate reductase
MSGLVLALPNPLPSWLLKSQNFFCLPFTPEVDATLFGPNGVAEGAGKGSMIIDTSTIYVSDAQAFQTRLKAFELSYSDFLYQGYPFGRRMVALR